jgi:micrococcal nuclease
MAALLAGFWYLVSQGYLSDGVFSPNRTAAVELVEAVYQRAVDGDTLIVTVAGNKTRVRLIGIDTPESTRCDEHPCTLEGSEAAGYTAGLLTTGQTVYLEYDQDPEDRYGRTLAYVWLQDDCRFADFHDFRQYCLNAVILENTYCDLDTVAPNTKYLRWFRRLQRLKTVQG